MTTFLKTARQSLYSLEAFSDDLINVDELRQLFKHQSSIMTNPAATARYYELTGDKLALDYLREVEQHNEQSGMQCLYPFVFQEISWVLLNAVRGGIDIEQFYSQELDLLQQNLTTDGIGASYHLTQDADDTSMALSVLSQTERSLVIDATVLERWWNPDFNAYETFGKSFRSKPDVSTNVHVLQAALLDQTVAADYKRIVAERVLGFLSISARYDVVSQGRFWIDKWNLSPCYPALEVVSALSKLYNVLPNVEFDVGAMVVAVVNHLVSLQTESGGFQSQQSYGPTVEETAYSVLALKIVLNMKLLPIENHKKVLVTIERGLAFIAAYKHQYFPPLWVAKGLYSPRNVIWSAIVASEVLEVNA